MIINYPAQVISYQKISGTLQDAGNTTTIASYLPLLSNAFLLVPLQRYSATPIRQRGSIPKILIFDNGLISAMRGITFKTVIKDKAVWPRLIENACGAQLYFISQKERGEGFYSHTQESPAFHGGDEVGYRSSFSPKPCSFRTGCGGLLAGAQLLK